jgi:hypothetical protein
VPKAKRRIISEIDETMRLASGFNRYRSLSPDEALGSPLYKYGTVHAGRLGSYWTTSVDVPTVDLAGLRPVVQSKGRLREVANARKAGISLPSIELGVFRDGSAWIVDGNHRLVDARQAQLPSVPVVFTFVGT